MSKRARSYTVVDNRAFKKVRGAGAYSGAITKSVPVTRTAQRRFARRRMIVPGYTRSSGAYGRYNGCGAEMKFFDTAISFACDNTAEVPATGQLCLIPQGDTSSTRDGRQATIRSIQLRLMGNFAPGAAATPFTIIKLFVILDKQCNGAAATQTDIFTSSAVNTAMFNLDNSDRFVILKQWTKVLNPLAGATTAYNAVTFAIEWYKKVNIPIIWNSTAGAITEIRSNNIFLYAGAYNSDDTVTITGTCRLRFQG